MAVELDIHVVEILQRYSAGDISAREAAKEIGPQASQHDVFAGLHAAGLPLPKPSSDEGRPSSQVAGSGEAVARCEESRADQEL